MSTKTTNKPKAKAQIGLKLRNNKSVHYANLDPSLPLPVAKHEAFCLNVLKGYALLPAYKLANPSEADSKHGTLASKSSLLHAREYIRTRINWLKASAVSDAVATRGEALAFVTSVMRTPIADVGTDSPLAQEVTETEAGRKVKMPSKMEAVKLLASMQGWEQAKELKLSGSVGIIPRHLQTMTPEQLENFVKE